VKQCAEQQTTSFVVHLTVAPGAAVALLAAVASGRSLPSVLSSIVNDWSAMPKSG